MTGLAHSVLLFLLPPLVLELRAQTPIRPEIRKLGTVDLLMVETTPVVYRDRLYRFEYVRKDYHANKTGDSYFRFIDIETGKATTAFAKGFDLGCACADEDAMWVFGVDNWDGENIAVFRSIDLKHWEQHAVLKLRGWGLFNTSVSKAENRYVMAIEVGRPPEVVGVPFTMRFAESRNLLDWKLLPAASVYTKERYSACPALRFLDGWFYMLYLETRPGPNYETHIVRSKDLIRWDASPFNPVLKASPADKQIANPKLTTEQRTKIAAAVDLNNSDMDLCEFRGKTMITYSWGNQQGTEFLAEAVYDGTLASFLKGFFPESSPGKSLPVPGEIFRVAGHTAFLILPKDKNETKALPWVWYAPTLPGLPGPEEKWMFQKFLDAGMAIAGIDVGESFGSPSGRAIYSSFHEELVQRRGLSKKPCLLARSRGGLMLYNWAVEHPDSVACIAGIYPVCNLSSYPGIDKACRAYGMTRQQLTSVIAQHNPVDRVEPLAKAGVPVFHIHGDVDTVVPLETNSAELAQHYRRFGGEMTLIVMKGQGHNMWSGWFQCQKLVDFVIAHARGKGLDSP
jgi:predicted esterase